MMNAMKKFAAQQLTKKQMTEVNGGKKYKCTITYADGSTAKLKFKSDNFADALDKAWSVTPEDGRVEC